jgi:hypothetical protein
MLIYQHATGVSQKYLSKLKRDLPLLSLSETKDHLNKKMRDLIMRLFYQGKNGF